ncbi:hypothetical protein PBRA_001517 [Plasmodiophora brassicae]|uniref:FAM50A/XAP5 C-terminal domain-containing protein n=1 Tax=Plasmodiophora brassicae TaxID=37360 RepID=A0A0G4IYL8_PLABS|nr:hypothetical protein PBRA_001517 [Plasmodiophora brassicae]
MDRRSTLAQTRKNDADKIAAQAAAVKKEEELRKLDSAFKTYESSGLEAQFKTDTVGLLSASEFRQKKAQIDQLRLEAEKRRLKQAKESKKRRRVNVLSFDDDDAGREEETNTEGQISEVRVVKDPTVDTSFLKDADREASDKALRQRFEREWHEQQAKIKQESLEIVYSYWDGTGNRKSLTVKKGDRIDQFLEVARRQLCKEFPLLKGLTCEHLMYVKEDVIVPHHYTFYELILNKARGKSGPLFRFDVHDDIRLISDATVEKEDSHAGKVMTRSWYERNKHTYPCCRWEVYDPSKQ